MRSREEFSRVIKTMSKDSLLNQKRVYWNLFLENSCTRYLECHERLELIEEQLEQIKTGANRFEELVVKTGEVTISREDLDLIYSLLPSWVKGEVPKNLDATFYGTNGYEGDVEVTNDIKRIFKR